MAVILDTLSKVMDSATPSNDDIAALADSRHSDPFSVLGLHADRNGCIVRVYMPQADGIDLLVEGDSAGASSRSMKETSQGLFECRLEREQPYRLRVRWPGGEQTIADPYTFRPQLSALDLHLFKEGRHFDLSTRFGANLHEVDGVMGVLFAVWAPNARAASVVGDFNSWDSRRHPMRLRHEAGIWELFVPGIEAGAVYKYAFTSANGHKVDWKADPLARQAELPPRTGSVVAQRLSHIWRDDIWMGSRRDRQMKDRPVSVYEVHVSSWLRTYDHQVSTWDDAIERLIPHAKMMGFTHIELMPVAEHPFGGSWGYQPLALFAPTGRLGTQEGLARFIDACHAADLGVLVDWVPAHFPTDIHGMGRFDGTELYEHQDPREGFHQDWNTLIYNAGRTEVRNFLIASAVWWLREFHIDGLRVDAVASMLYRDYSREYGEWLPNIHGGRENLENVEFLKDLNTTVAEHCPGAIMIAEESTAWEGITRPVSEGGLGFHYKWNLGWMHDTLEFFERDPIHRRYHMRDVTFGLVYGFSENFMLSLSHDEVVHGKGSMYDKMPGDEWQKFANLRLCLGDMFTHPGKKLMFMGIEFGQAGEWRVDPAFPWPGGDDRYRAGLMHFVRDLNAIYRSEPALHRLDCSPDGFRWVIESDTENTVFAYRRISGDPREDMLVIMNATPVPREGYRVGVPNAGFWREHLNSDAAFYGGSNMGNGGGVASETIPAHEFAQSIALTLPPLSILILKADHQ